MNVKINETGEVKVLSIRNGNGIDWTQDLVGNAGAFVDGQFVWSEEDDAYLASQSTYDWWANYIAESNATDREVTELADELGIDESVIRERIDELMAGVNDYDQHRGVALQAMSEIRDEAA